MASTSGHDIPVEVHFAQRLASNEKKIRDRALKKLRKWFEAKSSSKDDPFTEEDFIKLWKGLHYCLWMQDKPLLQEELMERITQLIHAFKGTDSSMLFLDTFLQTEAREWDLLDKWRMDKFMLLMRRMLNQALMFLKDKKWKSEVVTQFTDIIATQLLSTTNEKIPENLRLHFCDIYLDELEKTGSEQLSSEQVLTFLQPFFMFMPQAKNKDILKQVISRVFQSVLTQSVDDAVQEAKRQIQMEEEGSTEDEDDEAPSRLDFDYDAIANRLFELGSEKQCLGRNRNLIFELVTKFRDLDKGVFTVEESIAPGVSRRLKQQDRKDKQKIKWRQAKKEALLADKSECESQTSDSAPEKKKKKRKNRKSVNVEIDETEDNEEPMCSPPKQKKKPTKGVDGNTIESKSKYTSVKNKKKGGNSEDTANDAEQNYKNNKKGTKRKSDKITSVKEKSQIEHQESVDKESVKITKKTKKNKSKGKTSASKVLSQSALSVATENSVSISDVPDVVSVEKARKVKGRKTSSKNKTTIDDSFSVPVFDESNESHDISCVDDTHTKTTGNKKKKGVKSEVAMGDEGDLEIWVPSKKYKGALKGQFEQQQAENEKLLADALKAENNKKVATKPGKSRSEFASFDSLMSTPPAFVRKAVAKVTTPASAVARSKKMKAMQTAASAPVDRSRRVSFGLHKNIAQDFEDSFTSMTPEPFNPVKQPDQGILKVRAASMSKVKRVKSRKLDKKSKTQTPKRSLASDFF